MAREWWVNSSGDNLLKGIDGDPDNPIRLGDAFIVDFLRRYATARSSFDRLFPGMLENERTRLAALAEQADYVYVSDKSVLDALQSARNRAGVRTSGPMGGRRMQRW